MIAAAGIVELKGVARDAIDEGGGEGRGHSGSSPERHSPRSIGAPGRAAACLALVRQAIPGQEH